MDGTKYRCVVTSEQGGSPPQRGGANGDVAHGDPAYRFRPALFPYRLRRRQRTAARSPRENGGAYFLSAGGKVTLKTEVTKTGVPGIGDGTVLPVLPHGRRGDEDCGQSRTRKRRGIA